MTRIVRGRATVRPAPGAEDDSIFDRLRPQQLPAPQRPLKRRPFLNYNDAFHTAFTVEDDRSRTSGEFLESRCRRALLELVMNCPGALLGCKQRSVDFHVVNARDVDSVLPASNWPRHRVLRSASYILALPTGLRDLASFHNHFYGAAHANEQYGQAREPPGALCQDVTRLAVAVVVPYVDYHVQAKSTMGGNRFVHRCVQRHNQRLRVRSLSSRPQAHPWAIARRNDVPHKCIHAKVYPEALERFLNDGNDARLSRSGGTIQDNDLSRLCSLIHITREWVCFHVGG